MSTDITPFAPSTELSDQINYAQTVSRAALLPAAYRGRPADVLVAVGLGQAIGIAPAQSLYEIYVVNGRPSPSANLMAGLVRRAGHKLRIEGDATRCTATLIRKDDPDAPFTATWTIEQANAAKLTGKDTWRQYPAAMLRARAISEVVRMGASEAVLGMDYSAEEMRDVEQSAAAPAAKPRGMDAVRAAVTPSAGQVTDAPPEGVLINHEAQDAEVVDETTGEFDTISDGQRRAMFAAFTDAGFTTDARSAEGRAARLEYISRIVGRPVESSSDLTTGEASQVLDALNADAEEGQA